MLPRTLSCCVVSVLLCCTPEIGPVAPAPLHAQQIVGKQCEHCGRAVPITSQLFDTCPHCGVTWNCRRDRYVGGGYVPNRVNPNAGSTFDPLLIDDAEPVPSGSSEVASPGERYRLTRSRAGWVDVHDAETDEHLKFPHDISVPLRPELFSTDEELLVTVTGGQINIWELQTGAARDRFARNVVAVAFLPGEHTLAILNLNSLYFRSASGAIVWGRINANRGRFLELVLRFPETGAPTIFARTTNARGGIYNLDGTLLTAAQRLPRYGSSTQLTLHD